MLRAPWLALDLDSAQASSGGAVVSISEIDPATIALEDIDVMSNIAHDNGVPHQLLERLRRERPIHFQKVPDPALYDECWVLLKHEDVLAASRDTEHFINGHGLNLRGDYTDEEPRHLLNVDDPYHLALRRITNKGFTPKVVRRYEEHYTDLAGQLLDEAIAKGASFDVVDALSVPLPLIAICELLGTVPEDREMLIDWSNAIITNADPEYMVTPDARNEALAGMVQYSLDILADRRANPQDDLATVLAQHLEKGDLSQEEYQGYVVLLFVAGNETTRNNITHGMLQLARHPEQYQALRQAVADGNDDLVDTAVDEITRWASPVTYMSRTVTKAVDFKGHTFLPGQRVVLHYASANRDEDVFDNPHQFDITRNPNDHIAFGFGAHFCLGVHLAKLETKCLLRELAKRVESFELNGEPDYLRSSFIGGIKRLPVSVTPA